MTVLLWLNGEVQLKITELKQKITLYLQPPYTLKKTVVIGGSLLVVIFLITFIIALIVHPSTNIAQPNKQANAMPTSVPTKAPSNPFTGGGRYQNKVYSVAFPKGSQNTVNTFDGGDTIIIHPPVGTYPGEPVLDVEAYHSKQNLTQKEMFYVATGATVVGLNIDGATLPELKNTYQMRTINSVQIKTPTQLRIAYIVKPNALYVFRMYYSSSTEIPADEALFSQFIKSFDLNTK